MPSCIPRLMLAAATLGALVLPGASAAADPWPTKPIRMVVPVAPGGCNDVISRRLSDRLTKTFGQTVVVDNRAGGGSTIGAVIADPEFAAFLKTNAAQPAHSTPQALQQLLAKDVVRWTETAKRAGIQQL